MTGFSFQTRARTIDHLGRGQIADSPTAVSELWKNAYDAYARNVSLHIFEADDPVACIFDDGRGMDADDLRRKWLVLGTEGKTEEDPEEEAFRSSVGLKKRIKQGEKGIGRLSVAFLSPATALISKKPNGKFAVVLVDWRLFENPFLSLSDIELPVADFENAADIVGGIAEMTKTLLANLVPYPDEDKGGRRRESIIEGWVRLEEQELEQNRPSTREAITETWSRLRVTSDLLDEWSVSLGLTDHGTAIFMIDIRDDLSAWLKPKGINTEDDRSRRRLVETLTGFTDPFAPPPPDVDPTAAPSIVDPEFDYEVVVKRAGRNSSVLTNKQVFGTDNLHSLEHYLDGAFDQTGTFRGRVVAFGKDLGIREMPPKNFLARADQDKIGTFAFCIGTFEQEAVSSTHPKEMHDELKLKAERYGGVAIYRDGLRVMPYGRADADFFNIEERRTRHAGRNFWSHRRSFGRVAFTRADNPNLKDKAGREGLVDNRAKAILRGLVENILITSSRDFFGTDSSFRKELLPQIEARNKAGQAAANRLGKAKKKNVRTFLRHQAPIMRETLAVAQSIAERAKAALDAGNPDDAAVISAGYLDISAKRSELKPPSLPPNMNDIEEKYRAYRDDFQDYLATLDEASKLLSTIESFHGSSSPEDAARTSFHRNQSILSARVDSYLKLLVGKLDEIKQAWTLTAQEDRGTYYREAHHLLADEIDRASLPKVLNSLDKNRFDLEDEFSNRWEPTISALENVRDGIDIDSALSVISDSAERLEDRMQDINAVALIGICVEIIGHELEDLDGEARRNLGRLPDEVRRSSAYKLALEAHNSLADRLRFLSPLKIAGYRSRTPISGGEIADYVGEYFERTMRTSRISFEATDSFRSLSVNDLKSRLFPVFINLVNNAVYWSSRSEDRRIVLDLQDGLVIVADSGPGVDPDDAERIFELFFTRRLGGRGVGLYLCRANLAVAGHTIRYATEQDPRILPGANVIIEFKGMTTNA